jgi:hypothetical protein
MEQYEAWNNKIIQELISCCAMTETIVKVIPPYSLFLSLVYELNHSGSEWPGL